MPNYPVVTTASSASTLWTQWSIQLNDAKLNAMVSPTVAWTEWSNQTPSFSLGNDTWTNWNIQISATSATSGFYTTDLMWENWQQGRNVGMAQQTGTRTVVTRLEAAPPPPPVVLSPREAYNERRQKQKMARERRESAEREARRLQVSNGKALRLLLENLSPEQREQYDQNRYFLVRGGTSGKEYHIEDRGSCHGNIFELDREGRRIKRLCVAPVGVPLHDAILGQKLFLEMSEEALIAKANVTMMRGLAN